MATIDELKEVVKETLEVCGVLDQIKAQIRTEVFTALEGEYRGAEAGIERPALSNENLLINELIREYLNFNNYNFTTSVLTAESGQPRAPMARDFLKHELNVSAEEGGAASVPLLYSLVSHFVNRTKQGRGGGMLRRAEERGVEELEDEERHFVIEGSG